MKVERCTLADVSGIAELERLYLSAPWSQTDLKNAVEDSSYALFKIEADGSIIGYGGVQIVLDEGNITNVAVDKAYRRKGAASALVEEIKAYCREKGVKKIWLEVYKENKAAVTLYNKLGFETAYARKNYYKEGDALIMSCEVPCSESVKV